MADSESMFYVGAVLAVVGVIFAPFVFVFVAIPESIARMRGGTLQTHFPQEARDNPAVRGSMMIFGWFGNFILFVLVLALLALLFLML